MPFNKEDTIPLNIKTSPVTGKTRKLRTGWTAEAAQDLITAHWNRFNYGDWVLSDYYLGKVKDFIFHVDGAVSLVFEDDKIYPEEDFVPATPQDIVKWRQHRKK